MTFRERLRAGEVLAGTWIKTPHPHVVEVLSLSPLDCLVLDAEHAPFDRRDLDACILAARAGGKPVLVRPASGAHEQLLNVLDLGSDGVIVPHVRSAAEAAAIERGMFGIQHEQVERRQAQHFDNMAVRGLDPGSGEQLTGAQAFAKGHAAARYRLRLASAAPSASAPSVP